MPMSLRHEQGSDPTLPAGQNLELLALTLVARTTEHFLVLLLAHALTTLFN